MIEPVGEGADTERQGTQLVDQVANFGLGHVGRDLVPALPPRPGVEAEELAAPAADEPLRPGSICAGHRDADHIDRLEQHRIAFRHALGHGDAGGLLEGHFGAVHLVVRAVGEGHRHVDHGEAERPFVHVVLDPGLDRRDVLARHDAAADGLGKVEARTPGQRFYVDMHVAELAVAAGLALEAAMLGGRFADRFLVRHPRHMRLHLEVGLVRHAIEGDLQVQLPLAPDQHLLGVRVLLERQGGILFRQPADGAGELDLVAAVFGLHRQRIDRRQLLGPGQLVLGLARRRQDVAGIDLVHAAKRHHRAGPGAAHLVDIMSLHAEQPGDARAVERHAVLDLAPPDAHQRQLAGMGHEAGLEHLGQGVAARADPAPGRRGGGVGHFVAQQLEEPADAVIAEAGAKQHRHDQALRHILGQVLVNLAFLRDHVLQELLEQGIAEVGQLLDELGARGFLALDHGIGKLDQIRGLARFVLIGPLARQIDVTGDVLAVADRHLAQHQGQARDRLQGLDHLGDAGRGGIHLVDEEAMGNLVVLEELEYRRHRHGAFDLGFADDDGGIGGHQGIERFLGQFDGPGTVDKYPGIAQELRRGDGKLGGHLPGAGLGHRIADGIAFLDRALARHRPAGVQKAFQQGRLAAEIGSYQRDAARRRNLRFAHFVLPVSVTRWSLSYPIVSIPIPGGDERAMPPGVAVNYYNAFDQSFSPPAGDAR